MNNEFVSPDHFAVPWAYHNDKIIHLRDWNGQKDLLCGGCKSPVSHRAGTNTRSRHFYHIGKKNGESGCSYMTTTHRIFRDATYEILRDEGMVKDIFLRPFFKQNVIEGEAFKEKIIPETKFIADCFFVPKNKDIPNVAFEIIVSHGLSNEKKRIIKNRGSLLYSTTVRLDFNRFEKFDNEIDMIEHAKNTIKQSLRFKEVRLNDVFAVSKVDISIPDTGTTFNCESKNGSISLGQRLYKSINSDHGNNFKCDARPEFGDHLCVDCSTSGVSRFGPYGFKNNNSYIWKCKDHKKIVLLNSS